MEQWIELALGTSIQFLIIHLQLCLSHEAKTQAGPKALRGNHQPHFCENACLIRAGNYCVSFFPKNIFTANKNHNEHKLFTHR